MASIKVAEGLHQIDTLALGQENTVAAYLVRGTKTALVDCGYASSFQSVLDGLAQFGVSPSSVDYLIPTHVHLDHAGAAGRLLKEMPNAKVIAHEKAVPHLVDPTRLIRSATMVFGKEIIELYGTPTEIPAERVTAVGKEASLDLGGGVTATIVHAPGHAPHQVSVMLDRSKVLITADAVGIVYPGVKPLIPTTPPPSLDPEALDATVRSLSQMDPALLLTPHFGLRRDVDSVFEQTVAKVKEWVGLVAGMKSRGMTLEAVSDALCAQVIEEAGASDIPLYARISVRTSAMGILHYLEKKA